MNSIVIRMYLFSDHLRIHKRSCISKKFDNQTCSMWTITKVNIIINCILFYLNKILNKINGFWLFLIDSLEVLDTCGENQCSIHENLLLNINKPKFQTWSWVWLNWNTQKLHRLFANIFVEKRNAL